jgi:hypothetical protein
MPIYRAPVVFISKNKHCTSPIPTPPRIERKASELTWLQNTTPSCLINWPIVDFIWNNTAADKATNTSLLLLGNFRVQRLLS